MYEAVIIHLDNLLIITLKSFRHWAWYQTQYLVVFLLPMTTFKNKFKKKFYLWSFNKFLKYLNQFWMISDDLILNDSLMVDSFYYWESENYKISYWVWYLWYQEIFLTLINYLKLFFEPQFTENGTETHFSLDDKTHVRLMTVSSGHRRSGLVHCLFVNNNEIVTLNS